MGGTCNLSISLLYSLIAYEYQRKFSHIWLPNSQELVVTPRNVSGAPSCPLVFYWIEPPKRPVHFFRFDSPNTNSATVSRVLRSELWKKKRSQLIQHWASVQETSSDGVIFRSGIKKNFSPVDSISFGLDSDACERVSSWVVRMRASADTILWWGWPATIRCGSTDVELGFFRDFDPISSWKFKKENWG